MTTGAQADDAGPRLSISFNLVDPELEGGRHDWGSATAALDVAALEDGLGFGEEELQAIAREIIAELAAEGHGHQRLHRLLSLLVEESHSVMEQLPVADWQVPWPEQAWFVVEGQGMSPWLTAKLVR